MHLLKTWLMFFLAAAILQQNPFSAAASDDSPRFQTIDEYIQAYAQESNPQARIKLFYNLTWHVERNNLKVDVQAAERLALFALRVARDPEVSYARRSALEFLSMYSHPAIADVIYELISYPDLDTASFYRAAGLAILVCLRDNRAFPLLLEELKAPSEYGHEKTIRLLAELGDPRAIEQLEQILTDENLETYFEKIILEDRKRKGLSTERAAKLAQSVAAEERENARRAVRDIQLLLNHNIICPFNLDDHAYEMLSRNGFVILAEPKNEMYEFYGAEYPFITTDVIFHTFMILMRASLDELETLILRERVGDFGMQMVQASLYQKRTLPHKELVELANHNAAFFAVPTVLCGATKLEHLDLTEPWQRIVRDELARIREAGSVAPSVILGLEEDYTEYKPRGRHSAKPDLSGYFKGMTWLGRAAFSVDLEDATKRALLLLNVLEREPRLREEWEDLDRLLGQFFGQRDDLAFPDYWNAAREVAKPKDGKSAQSILESSALFENFSAELRKFPAPRINTAFIRWPQSSDWKTRTFGLRIFGQRYTRDEHIVQQLLDNDYWPPSGLYVLANLLSSGGAKQILTLQDHKSTPKDLVAPLPLADRLSGLAEGYLYCFEPIFNPDAGVPTFMHKPAWEEKQMNTALGAWAEVRNSVSLYAKAAHMYAGLSMMTDRFHGYVEPYPQFFVRLDSLVQRVDKLLVASGCFERIGTDRERIQRQLDEDHKTADPLGHYERELAAMRLDRSMLHEFSTILKHLGAIALQELQGQPQSIEDGIFLKNLARRLRSLSFNRSSMNIAEKPMSVITDVATEYLRKECLEVGVGRPLPIYVSVPDSGRNFVCKGAVYTYYEFTWPFTDRLEDIRWRSASKQLEAMGISPWIITRPELGLQGR